MMLLINPWFWCSVLVSSLLSAGGGVFIGSRLEVASQAREQNHIAEAVDAANGASAQAIAKIKVTNTTIANEVQREIQTNTIFNDCRSTTDGVRLVNEALSGKPRAAGDSIVPRTNAVK